VQHEYGINSTKVTSELPSLGGVGGGRYGAIILAVAHNEFLKIDLNTHKNSGAVIYDVKGILSKNRFM
jgi:UDP-N-acetyl-D-glucosamine/UDP-N-acetyl-D-galactosamine dehydrogenase